MVVISETIGHHRLLRSAAMAVVILPMAFLAACSQQRAQQPAPVEAAPPPQAAPPPAAPAPAPVPPARG